MNDKLLTWDEIIKEHGIYMAVEDNSDGYERYVVVSSTRYIPAPLNGVTNGICYVGFKRTRAEVSPSLMGENDNRVAIEPVICIHEEIQRWIKCDHLDIRLCLRTED